LADAPATLDSAPPGPPQGTARRFLSERIVPRWREIGLALLISIGLAAATTAYPAIIKHSFDTLGQGKTDKLWWVLAAIIAATAMRGLFLYFHQINSATIVMRIGVDLQRQTFAHIVSADYARLTREAPGHFLARMTNDIAILQGAAQNVINSVMRDVVSVIGLVGYMLWTDWMLSLIVICIYPLTALPIIAVSRRLKRTARQTQMQVGDMIANLTEKFSGLRLIKAYRLESYTKKSLDQSFDRVLGLRIKAVRQRARLSPILEAFAGLAIAGVIGLATWRISAGIASTGDFMAFVTCLLLAANNLRSVGNFTTNIQDGLAAAERLHELIDERPSVVTRPGARPLRLTNGAITFENVTFRYESQIDGAAAVRAFTLDIPGGQTAALVGRSGSGKSTIINLVPRLFDVTSGRIAIDGQDLRDVTLDSLRDQIAIVSQDVTLFDDTIRANIALGRLGASEADIVNAAKAAAAHDFIMAQPHGYDTMIGDAGLRLSGGQRQRVALARAILRDAPILLLDEATSALDTESERAVQGALQKFTKNRTTLVIAHRLSTVQHADIICVMDDGRIVEAGRHAELLARDGIYAQLCRAQLITEIGSASSESAPVSTRVH
jgi:subfamily B ATP-binding cassette protein MsbA